MAASDPIADMLAKVQNAARAGHEKVDVPTSKMKLEIVKILKTEGSGPVTEQMQYLPPRHSAKQPTDRKSVV